MTKERFKLSTGGNDTEGYITDKIEHKTYFLRSDDVKKEINRILNQFYNENEDLKTDISVLNRYYDEYANVCAKLKKENEQLNEKLESVGEIIDNQIYAVKHTHKNCKRVGITELKKLKKVLICNGIINGDVE